MSSGELLIVWSIRMAMLLFFVSLTLLVGKSERQRMPVVLKILWTASFVLIVLHVAAAFHFVHHWSHGEAYRATAEETRQMLGFAYGAGIYFNYFFLAVWAMDVFWVWLPSKGDSCATHWLVFAGRCYLLFIAINGLVVFETGWLRAFGVLGTAVVLGVAWNRRRHLSPIRHGNE
jgi:hypothetical protein